MIGSDFIPTTVKYTRKCSERGKTLVAGSEGLASIKGGKVKKWVCSEDCRQEFDYRFWTEVALKRRGNDGSI